MLKAIRIRAVNAAWPMGKLTAAADQAARKTVRGSSTHRIHGCDSTARTTTVATTTPRIVPPIASKANFRVPTASKRRIDSTPSSTQKPCVTPVMLTTRTAIPRPSALRRELRSHGDSQCICDATIDRRGRMGMGGRRSRDSTVPPFARRASSAICSTSRPDMRMR